MTLYRNFGLTCRQLGYSHELVDLLTKAYTESGRHYHNLEHIETMLSHLEKDREKISPDWWRMVAKAILWHDFHYKFHNIRGENEGLSAYAFALNDPVLDENEKRYVMRLIFASANHVEDQKLAKADDTIGYFLDLDLSSFAQDWRTYEEEADLVLKELEPHAPIDALLYGSIAFLQTLLRRKAIYYVNRHWEYPARANIERRFYDLTDRLHKLTGTDSKRS